MLIIEKEFLATALPIPQSPLAFIHNADSNKGKG